MTNAEFLDTYLHMQSGIIFDKLTKFNESILTFCQADEATYWNFALVKRVMSEQEIDNLAQAFIKLKRIPSIYFEDKPELYPLKELLTRKGYKISYEDSWMFYEQASVHLPADYKVISVSSDQELEIFLDIFNKCYQKDDPQNPYGEFGEGYLKIISDSWYNYHQSQRVECFIFYKNQEPVAVSALTNYEDAGYISNVGSVRHVRGQGFGRLATLHCVKKSIEKGHNYHFLATEAGHYPHKFYQRIGFKTKFTAIDFAKE
ncbi:MAG TPA: GNAT family N-acetyltransferase [Methylomirabilota bacterium]|nr:GNAT family N-acetyltransferase [Methylomirabilota bacterium]